MKNALLKILTLIFALCMVVSVATACGGGNNNGGNDNPPAHTCEYTQLKSDETNHWYECSCENKSGVEAHKGGEATCNAQAICSVCSQSYGALADHEYENGSCKLCGEKAPSEGLEYRLINSDIGYKVSVGTCTDIDIIIPSTYLGKPVTSIGDYAFRACGSLKSIVIPNSVKSIGDWAFYGCYSLQSVEIGNSVTSIDDYAFWNCDSLTSIDIPNSVTSIGERAFSVCRSLQSIEVDSANEYYKSIDGNLYSKDGKILMQYALGKTATSFTIPNSVTSIGYGAFRACYSLESVVIPNSVTSIGESAFSYCDSLQSIEIGNSVTSIGDWAFSNCCSLISITFNGTKEEWMAIEKDYTWKYYVPAIKVQCADGSVDI